MTTEPIPIIAGALLFLLAGGSAALTTRHLTRTSTATSDHHQHGALRSLLHLLLTAALAVGAASLWAGPGLDIGSTWPFALALVIALTPLAIAAVRRRRQTAAPAAHDRPAP